MTVARRAGAAAALFLAVLVAAAAPALAADVPKPPVPAPAPAPTVEKDLQRAVLEHPPAFVALVLTKFVPAIAGVVVLVLWTLRRRDERRGLRLPDPPPAPPPAPMRVPAALALVLALPALALVLQLVGVRGDAAPDARRSLVPGLLAQTAIMGPLAVLGYVALRRARARGGASALALHVDRAFEAALPPLPRAPWRAGPSLQEALAAFCVAGAVVLAAGLGWKAVLDGLGHETAPQDLVRRVVHDDDATSVAVLVAYGCVVAPLTEECLYRGVLFPALRDAAGLRAGVGLSALVFAAVHRDLTAAGPLAALAVVLALLYQRTGSLLAVVSVHALNNATTFVPLLLAR